MVDLQNGKSIWIKCLEVQPGPFDEKLVVIDSHPTHLSGFVNERYLQQKGADWYVHGTIRGVGADNITVGLPGSFFTAASGIALIPRSWAQSNVEEA